VTAVKSIDTPLYTSGPTWKSLGNAYYIYADRIELRCRFPFFTRPLIITRDDLISIDVFKPPVIRTAFLAFKLDLADLSEHVGLKRKNGFFKQLRFTPEHPREFVAAAIALFKLS
jgi:hypothetical protein